MDRHTESFICLSLFVILLQNTARSQECSNSYREAPGNISELIDTNHPTYLCRYHVVAPLGHYISLNVTGLLGMPLVSKCSPKIVIRNIGRQTTPKIICYNNQGNPLPQSVQSTDNELKIVFRGHDRQTSSFNATFTFHRKQEASAECLECAQTTKNHITRLSARAASAASSSSSNSSVMSPSGNFSKNQHLDDHHTQPPKTVPRDRSMELFVLILLAPVTVVCVCCVIMYYRRRTNSSTHQQTPRLPSDASPPVSASHDPLLLPHSHSHSHSHSFPSALHNTQSLRHKRETIYQHSESTEKYPPSVVLRDGEKESSSMQNIVLNRDIFRNGIRAPENRTVYDCQRQDNMRSERSRQQQQQQQQQQQHHQQRSPHVTPQLSVPRIHPLLRTESGRAGTSRNLLVDSVTRSPLQFGDSDSEAPPPYTSIPSNTGNVCEPQHLVASNSAAAAAAGHQVRHHGRAGAHPQHANGRHPPPLVPLSPHFELDADQGERRRTDATDRLDRMERSDHEITDVL